MVRKLYMVMILMMVLALSGCDELLTSEAVENEERTTENEDYSELYDYDNIYNQASKLDLVNSYNEIGELIQQRNIELKSINYDEINRIIQLNYDLNLSKTGDIYYFDYLKELQDSIVILAAFDDLDGVLFQYIQEPDYRTEGLEYNRIRIKEIIGFDIIDYGSSIDNFTKELPGIINQLEYQPEIIEYIDYEHAMGLDEE